MRQRSGKSWSTIPRASTSTDQFRSKRLSYQRSLILTCFMAVGERPVRSDARRDAVPSGKRRDAAGRSPTATEGREKFTTGASRSASGAPHPRIGYWGASRSCPMVKFSPVKQVNINDRWYQAAIAQPILFSRASRASLPSAAFPRTPAGRRRVIIRRAVLFGLVRAHRLIQAARLSATR